jgi:diguanylate cyclase (GGDEF)-like protein
MTDDHRQQTRVGIIGAGHGGQALLEAFAEMPDVRIIGICDIEPDAPGLKQAAAMGVPVYGDAASMLRGGGLDWVFNVSNASTEQRFLLSQELGGARIIDGDVANMVWRILTSFVGEASRGPLRDVSGAQREALFALAWRIIRDFADIGQLSHDNFASMAFRDPLTGLYTRRFLMSSLEQGIASARRHGRPLTLLFIDLDYFKSVNDRFGHDVGDKVLRMVGGAIASDCRQGDVAARDGGEEFAIVLPNTDAIQARQIAERLCQKVATEVMRPDGHPQTISIGVATISPSAATGFSPQAPQARLDVRAQLLKHADRAVYEASGEAAN